ncbi:MAG: glycerol-3-phosphate 1-O-acyltransferase PlsY [Oscillospiraceae bacterium]|nr:glycerol-3-phosphate 1-O-acyltransferase PlsY [Oscillospiraceae bacterium]
MKEILFIAAGLLLSAAAGYLLGSVSFAVVVSRGMYHQDVRDYGSGNAGMTNVLRTYGKKAAILTLAGDFCKGAAAVLLGRLIFWLFRLDFMDGAYVAGMFALLGHLFPLYFGFKGGKGILTSIGVIALIDPLVGLALLAVGLPLILITRMVSVGSLAGAVCYPAFTYLAGMWRGENPLLDTVFAALISLLVIYMHRANIKRLLNGTENRFGQKKK